MVTHLLPADETAVRANWHLAVGKPPVNMLRPLGRGVAEPPSVRVLVTEPAALAAVFIFIHTLFIYIKEGGVTNGGLT